MLLPLFRILIFDLFIVGMGLAINLLQAPSIILLVLPFIGSRKLFRRYNAQLERVYGSVVTVVTHLLTPTELVINGHFDELKNDPYAIIFSNHQTYTDWWYLWNLAWICGRHGDLRIILKDSLKHVPIIGWGMQCFEFIFLKRKWALDKPIMEKNLRIDALHDLPIWLVIFPEGTVICNDTQQKTRAYAKKADLTDDPTYVLHPKSTGLFHACQYLYPKVTNIYDVTMAFSDVPPNTHAFDSYSPIGIFMFNRRPPKVFINIKKHSFSNVPGLGDSIEQSSTTQSPNTTNSISSVEPEFQARLDVFTSWLRRQFMIKDDLLKEFHLKSSKFLGTEPSRSFNVIPNWRDWFGIFITSITSLLISSNLLFLYTLNKKWAGF